MRLAAHRAPAAGSCARFAFAAVDGEFLLEAAELAVGLLVVAQRGAAGADGIDEHRLDLRNQTLGRGRGLAGLGCEARGAFPGIEAGAEERFAHVDVAEAGDDALVHQEGLEVDFLAACPPGEIGRVQVVAQGLDAQAAKESVLFYFGSRDQRHVSETAGIVVRDDGAARHRENQVVVLGVMACSWFVELSIPPGRG